MAAANQMKSLPPPPPSPRVPSPRPAHTSSNSAHMSSNSSPSVSSSTSSPASGSDASFKNGRPRSFRDMQLLTQFVSAAKQSSAIGLPEELAILTGGPSVEGPATNLGGYFSHEMALVHDQDDEERLEEEAGGSGGAASPPETENQRPVTGDGGLYLQDRETTDFLTHHHHLHQHDLHQQQLQHLPRRQHNLGQMSPARSPEQISPRPTTGWLSSLTSVQGSLQENVEVNEASLSTLEARLRHFLETGNPRDRPQVAQLRRLALEDMDVQPKPGNKVVVRRKDPLKVVTPDAPVNLMARILTRPRVAENGTAGLSRREKQLL